MSRILANGLITGPIEHADVGAGRVRFGSPGNVGARVADPS